MDIIRLGIVAASSAEAISYTDDFERADGSLGSDWEDIPQERWDDSEDVLPMEIQSGGCIYEGGSPDHDPAVGAVRFLTSVPGDQRIEITCSLPVGIRGDNPNQIFNDFALLAHVSPTDHRRRAGGFTVYTGTYLPYTNVYDTAADGTFLGFVDDTLEASGIPAEGENFTIRFESYLNGDWKLYWNGTLVDSGTDTLPWTPGEYCGFSLAWYNSPDWNDEISPRVESFTVGTIGDDSGLLSFSGSAIINGLTSKTWIERYAEPGEFKVVGTLTGNEVESFQGDAFDGLPLGALVSHLDTYEVMVVESREIVIDEHGDPQITVSGRSLETVLDQRVVGSNRHFPYSATPLPDFSVPAGRLGDQILYMLDWHLGTGVYGLLDSRDRIPGLKPINQSTSPANFVARTIKRGSLYDRTKELLALDKMGIRIVRPNPTNTLGNLIALSLHNGVDRRNRVEFTSAGGDLEKVSYLFSNKSKKNAALITGRWLETMVKGVQSGYDRGVMYIDGSDIDRSYEVAPTGATRTTLLNRMAARARQALASQTGVSITNVELVAEPPFIYRVDYNCGDLVTIHGDFNVRAVKRVTEYTETEDEMGESSYPTFGEV